MPEKSGVVPELVVPFVFTLNSFDGKEMKQKLAFRGQAAGGLSASAIAIIVLVITVAIGATIVTTIGDSGVGKGTATQATNNNITVNESVGEQAFTFASGLESPTASAVVAFNATLASQIYTSGNYTTTGSGVNWATALANGTSVSFNFTTSYSTRSVAFNITVKGTDALKTYSDFFSTIVIILVFVVIIGLLAFFGASGFGRGGRV